MVGHHQPVHPDLGRAQCVVRAHDALQDQRARPERAEALDIGPGEVGRDLLGHEFSDLQRGSAGRRIGLPVLKHGEAVAHVVLQPERMPERIQLRSEREPERAGEAVAPVALAVGMDGNIDRDDQGRNPEVRRAPDHVFRNRPVLRRVHLVPAMLRRLARHVLHRGVGSSGHDEGDIGVARGPRQHQVAAAAVIADAAGGRDAVGAGPGAAEQLHRLVDLRDIDHVTRHEGALLKGVLIAPEPVLVLHAALDEVVNQLRHALLRHRAQIVEVDALVDIHPGPLPTPAAAVPSRAVFPTASILSAAIFQDPHGQAVLPPLPFFALTPLADRCGARPPGHSRNGRSPCSPGSFS